VLEFEYNKINKYLKKSNKILVLFIRTIYIIIILSFSSKLAKLVVEGKIMFSWESIYALQRLLGDKFISILYLV